ncbi:unnamed protein product [Oikopleura dioica]|uniref:Carboxylic ester hydrolase n=1 Tax=Oikopleura dioica TaxID=34765 RepID=E4XRS5_OIKDI|nr:unnamed protein product [Oikopleura dioica]
MKLLVFIFSLAFSESVETRINDGLIVGNRDYYQGKSVDEYLGIPFAQPPVENLRFKSPQKPDPWTVLETQKKKPLCAQPDVNISCWGLPQSEDCLYVDVYTASENYETDAKPVLVWIHGGSFTGDWHPDWYTGKYLCPTADVVLVVVNYRLGALGFLSLQDNVIAGNMGVRDQNMALEWVHDNIGNFGGDPDNVTIFGQSAGAISVKFQANSPMSGTRENPLFKRVGVVSFEHKKRVGQIFSPEKLFFFIHESSKIRYLNEKTSFQIRA